MQRLYVPSHDMQMLQAASKGEWSKVRAGIISVTQINKYDSSGFESGMTILLFAARDKKWDLVDEICQDYKYVDVNAQQESPGSGYSNPDFAIDEMNRIRDLPEYAHLDHNALWFALEDKQFFSAENLVRKGAILSTTEGITADALQQYEAIKERVARLVSNTHGHAEQPRTNSRLTL